MNAGEKVTKARTKLIIGYPFIGEISLRLLPVESKETTNTMAVDGLRLYYNPDYVERLTDTECIGVVAHEVGHCIFRHCGEEGARRRGGRNPKIWDIACEFKVNQLVRDDFQLELPGNTLYNKKYDHSWTTVGIYHDLMRKVQKSGSVGELGQLTDDHSQWGKGRANDQNAPDGQQRAPENGSIDNLHGSWIAAAAQNAKMCGKLPAGVERLIEDLLEPKLPWQQMLARFALGLARDDYSWKRGNRRHLYRKLFLPSLRSPKITMGFFMDTSGSMAQEELQEGLAELRGALSAFPSYEAHLMSCDAAVQFHQVVNQMDFPDIKGMVKGGGGTDFRPPMHKVEKLGLKLDAVIYFTDAMGPFPEYPPPYPVLWVVKGNAPTPWGIRCEL